MLYSRSILQDAIGYGIMIANGCRFGLAGFFEEPKDTPTIPILVALPTGIVGSFWDAAGWLSGVVL